VPQDGQWVFISVLVGLEIGRSAERDDVALLLPPFALILVKCSECGFRGMAISVPN